MHNNYNGMVQYIIYNNYNDYTITTGRLKLTSHASGIIDGASLLYKNNFFNFSV